LGYSQQYIPNQSSQGQSRFPISQFNQEQNNLSNSQSKSSGNFQGSRSNNFERNRNEMSNIKASNQQNMPVELNKQISQNINQMPAIQQRVPSNMQFNQLIPQNNMEYNKARDLPINIPQNFNEPTTPVSKIIPPQINANVPVMQTKQAPLNSMTPPAQAGFQNNPQNIPQTQVNLAIPPNQKIPYMQQNNSNFYERPNSQNINYSNPNMYQNSEEMNSNYGNQNMNYNMGNPNMQGQYMRQQQQQQPASLNFPIQGQNPNFYQPQQVNPNSYTQMNQGYQMSNYNASGQNNNSGNKMMNAPVPHQTLQIANISNDERRLLLEKLKSMGNWKERPNEMAANQQTAGGKIREKI